MRYPKNIRPVSVLFLLILLIGCGGLIALSAPAPATSNRGGGSPFRLRLQVKNNTLPSGGGTSIWAEFLDRDYNPVQIDGTRVIRFVATPRGSGGFSKDEVTVKAGDWSAPTWFSPTEPGKVVITASSEPLDLDQTVLIVTQEKASWFSQLFETVAYADAPGSFGFTPKSDSVSAGDKSRIKFQLSWDPAPSENTIVEVSTNPAAKIKYGDKDFYGSVPVAFHKGSGVADAIYVSSATEGTISVTAKSPDGKQADAVAKFTKSGKLRIIFDDEPRDIAPNQNRIPITLKLADDGGNIVETDQPRQLALCSGNSEDQVVFDPPSVPVSPPRSSAEAMIVVQKLAHGNELKVFARSEGLEFGTKTITIRTPIHGVEIRDVPSEVTPGQAATELSIVLVDKDRKSARTDKARTIHLTTNNGTLTPPSPMTIPAGESERKVLYTPASSGAKAIITARSEGFADWTAKIPLVAAPYWLVICALIGGLIGGIVRHIPGDFRLQRIVPRWTGEYWDLGFAGRLVGSIVGGLILFLLFRYGIHRLMGSPELPEALNLGSKLVAFFIGVPGGFAGIYVLRRLAGWLLPGSDQQTAEA